VAKQLKNNAKKSSKVASRPIIILGILSMLGFVFSVVSDLSYYMGVETYVNEEFEEGNPAKELYEQNILEWDKQGLDTTPLGLKKIARLFLIIGLINLPILLGVAFLFYRIKIGFEIYAVCQLAYMLIPIYMIGLDFYPLFRVLGYGDLFIMLLFVIMWGIQRKNMQKKPTVG